MTSGCSLRLATSPDPALSEASLLNEAQVLGIYTRDD